MAKNRKFTVKLRRKRTGRTDYSLRVNLLKSDKLRLVVRRFSNSIIAQIVRYENYNDKIIVSSKTQDLKNYDWNFHFGNTPSAYLLGLLLAKKANKMKIQEVILDLGLQRSVKGSTLYACCKGLEDGKISLNQNKKNYPSEERIQGAHIAEYAKKLKKDEESYKKQFSQKKNVDPENIQKIFNEVKLKINSMENG